MLKKQRGFTMIELLVSATIIILLTAAGMISFRQAAISSRNAKRKADLETMRQALALYKQDSGYYADTGSINFAGLVTNLYTAEYLTEATLEDPTGTAPYVYQATCASLSGTNCVKVTLRAVLEPSATVYDLTAL